MILKCNAKNYTPSRFDGKKLAIVAMETKLLAVICCCLAIVVVRHSSLFIMARLLSCLISSLLFCYYECVLAPLKAF